MKFISRCLTLLALITASLNAINPGIETYARQAWLQRQIQQTTSERSPLSDDRRRECLSSQQSSSDRLCNVCFDYRPAHEFTTLSCGNTMYCTDCLQQLVDTAIRDKNSTSLKCPHCAQPMTEQDIKNITQNNPAKLAAVTAIITKEWAATQPNVKNCPTPNCPYFYIDNNAQRHDIRCPECYHNFCSQCSLAHPADLSCQEAKRRVETTQERDNARWKAEHTKPCPSCQSPIEKNGGCPHMTCNRCHYEFCWNCLERNHTSGVCHRPAVFVNRAPSYAVRQAIKAAKIIGIVALTIGAFLVFRKVVRSLSQALQRLLTRQPLQKPLQNALRNPQQKAQFVSKYAAQLVKNARR